ncbi:molybdopterin-binding protein, partial [Embleya sp. NPDC056538]
MSLSIRNQFPGTTVSVTAGEVMAAVKVRLGSGRELTAAVTVDAVRDLGLAEGGAVLALIKSTEVSLATGGVDGLSIRNRIPGTVVEVVFG